MICVVFEENSKGFRGKGKGSYRFRVISAFKSRENRSLAQNGGKCRRLA
jgi:hypothetical protein